MDEVGNFVKNVLPRLVGDPAQSALSSLGISLTDDAGNMRDVIQVYTDVANKVKDISDTERIAVVEGLAGKFHISRMQALLDDLGSVDSMYRSMYETSKNSAGSAMRENEVYMKSLEARISLARVEVEKLAVSIGDAFLTDGMIAFLQGFASLLEVMSKAVGVVGALPIALGLGSTALLLMSTRARTLATDILLVGTTFTKASIQSKSLTGGILAVKTASDATTASTTRLGIAWKSLIASTGIGLGFVAVGFVLEKIIGTMGNARQKAEELESANKEMLNSYGQNADKIDELVGRYEELNTIQQNGKLDNTQLAEYRDIQNEIATLMPSLVTGEDKYGNKLIGSAEYIKIKTDLLKEQLAVEKEKAQIEEANNRNERISVNEDLMKDSKNDIKKTLSSFTNEVSGTNMEHMIDAEYKIKFIDDKGNPLLKTTEQLSKQLAEIQEKRKLAEASGNADVVNYYKSLEDSAKRYLGKLNESDIALRQGSASLKNDYVSSVEQAISANNDMSDSVKQSTNELMANLISASSPDKVVKLHDTLSTIFSDLDGEELTKGVVSSFDNLNKATADTFDGVVATTKNSIATLKETLIKDGTLTDSQINAVIKALTNELASTIVEFEKLPPEVKKSNISFEEMKVILPALEQGMDGASESASNLASKMKDFKDATESMAGVSQSGIDALNELIWQYDMLTNQLSGYTEQQLQDIYIKENLTAEEQRVKDVLDDRLDVMKELSGIYPDLFGKDGKAITLSKEKRKAIEQENEANKILLNGYKLSRDGKLSAEQDMTLSNAKNTLARIGNIKTEIAALDVLRRALQETHDEQIALVSEAEKKSLEAKADAEKAKRDKGKKYDQSIISAYDNYGRGASEAGRLLQITGSKTSALTNELLALEGQLKTDVGAIKGFTDAIEESDKKTKKATDSTSKANSTTKDSIYITDEYREKLEALNLEIEKQIKLQSTLPEHSDGYKKSLESQIKLEKEKLALIEKQAKSIESQIKSGKIKQTGTISSKSDAPSSQHLSGWNGKITSQYGGRKDPITGKSDSHRGMDIAMKQGTRLDANVSGKVVASGKAGTGNASKYHSSYGNIVVVQDDSGVKHLYAHLEKSIAKFGDIVEAGTQLGTIGSTGRSTGSHLHYETSKNGALIDPNSYYQNAKSGKVSPTSSGISTIDNTQQAIDQAKSDLNGLHSEILNQQQAIANLEKSSIDTALSGYEHKKSNYDKFLENSDNRLNKLTKSSQAYRDELDKQTNALNAKKAINQAEIARLKELIATGGLNEKVVAEYTNTLHELGKVNSDIDFKLKDVETSKLESYVDVVDELIGEYDKLRSDKDNSIELDTLSLEELDTGSVKYLKTLEKINSTMKDKQNFNNQELNRLQRLIANGKLYGEALENAKKRVNELTKEIKQLQLDIQEGNFNIIVNVKTQSDAKIDDMQFEIDRAEAVRKHYEEGSADYAKYTQTMIDYSKKMADQHLKTRDALVEELKQRDITIERRKEILELLEDEHMAYLNATLAIKDYTKQKEDAIDAQRKEIADNVINALKDAYQEYRDERMKMIDEEIKRENEKHERIMKQLNDEMDLFRKNVEERLRLIDRQEAERDYNMEIDDMEKERSKIQSEINLLSMDNSYEAKSKRKKLQEQLDKIDKDIAEKRHDRDIELQKQGLNDQLEMKENEINGKIEEQDREHEAVIKGIERQKEYWEKYYTDLLNDERKFAKIREDIMAGHFDKVQAELNQHIADLTATMPQLADTMDGTMQAVGMAIRQNVIDNLQIAMDMINKFNSMQIETSGSGGAGFNDGGFDPSASLNTPNSSSSSGNGSGNQSPQGKLVSDADLKVIMAKYMTDVLANQYDTVRANNIRDKAHAFAREARAQGATIDVNSHFNTELAKLSKEDQIRLSNVASSNYTVFDSTEMQNVLKRWSSSLKSRASALSGGMTSWSGNGIDGKGGKEMIVHPNELINSPLDTKNLLDMSNVMQRAMQFFTPVLKTMMKPTSLMNNISNSNGGDTYEINFTGDINNTSKSGARQFATDIMNEIRTKKG